LEFSDIFSDGSKIGRIPDEFNVKFKLKLLPGAKPMFQRGYSLSKFEEDWLFEE